MKKKFSQHIRKGLPGGANEINKFTQGVISTEGYRSNSPDKDNPVNVINSSSITMTEGDGKPLKKGPLFGIDNLGNRQLMMPGFDYQFPGSQVAEIPLDNLKEQLNPVRPRTLGPDSWAFLASQQAKGNIVGGAGINFPRGLAFNATGVLPVTPDPVFKGVGSLGLNQQFGNLNLGAKIKSPILRDYDTRKLKFNPEVSLSGRYTIPYTDKKKLSGPLLEEGGYVEAELSDKEIEMYKRGGYIVEELPSYQDQGEVKPGTRIIDVVPVLETGNCPDGYEYSSERKACVKKEITLPQTTIYGKEGKKKQRKLLDNFQLAQAAFKKWHKDAGFGNLILKGRRDKDDIKSLKGYVDDYKEELRKTKEQYKPASSALRVLKENYPKEWKKLKLKHVFDPQSVEQLRKLYKEGKISDSAFRWYYDSFGKGYDQNVAKGTGPDATYSAKETEDNWMHDAQGFTDMLGTGVNTLMLTLGAGAGLSGGGGAALGRLTSSGLRGAGTLLKNPWVQRGITGYGLAQVPRYATGAYDAYKKDDWGGVGENVAGAAISLAPGAIFKNTGKVLTGTGKTLARAFGKEAGAATKYAGNLISSPLRRIPGYSNFASGVSKFSNKTRSVPGLPNVNYNLKFIDDAIGAGAPKPTWNPLTGGKNILGSMYTTGKALALPTTALTVGSTVGSGSNLNLDQIGTAASKSLDIVNPISKLKGLSFVANNPLVEKYGLKGLHWLGREGKDIYKGATKQFQGDTDAAITKYLQAIAGSKNLAEYVLKNNKRAVTDYVHDVRLNPNFENILNPITKPLNEFLNPLNKPFRYDLKQQLPSIQRDPSGRVIDSEIQTTERMMDIDAPKKIIMAGNYGFDNDKFKLNSGTNSRLEEGGVVETELTQREIDMLRMGGYIVEEI